MVTSFASEPVSGLAVCLLTAASCTSKSAADECAPYVGKCKGSVYSCSPPASTHVTHQRMPLNAKEVICTSIQARETNIAFILPLILIQIDSLEDGSNAKTIMSHQLLHGSNKSIEFGRAFTKGKCTFE